jgi:hypothetical protein
MIQDNRALWFAKTAELRASDEGAWMQRYYHGRVVQLRVQPLDFTLDRLRALIKRQQGKVVAGPWGRRA